MVWKLESEQMLKYTFSKNSSNITPLAGFMGEDLIGFTAIELLNYYFIKLKSLCRLSGWHIKKKK